MLINIKTKLMLGLLSGVLPAMSWSIQPLVALSGGFDAATNVGQSLTFPIQNPDTDQYFIYSRNNASQSKAMFEGFVGGEKLVSKWRVQAGLAYTQAGNYKAQGPLVQGVDSQSDNTFSYHYKITARALMLQTKWLYAFKEKIYPYFLLGIGGSFNRAYDFSTNVPPFLTFTREYANHTASAFAYRLGLGVDTPINNHLRLGLAYRFADLGKVGLGSANIDGTPVSGRLSQSHFYNNEVLLQLTYLFK